MGKCKYQVTSCEFIEQVPPVLLMFYCPNRGKIHDNLPVKTVTDGFEWCFGKDSSTVWRKTTFGEIICKVDA